MFFRMSGILKAAHRALRPSFTAPLLRGIFSDVRRFLSASNRNQPGSVGLKSQRADRGLWSTASSADVKQAANQVFGQLLRTKVRAPPRLH